MELIVTRADNSNYNLPSENSKITSAVQTRTLMGEDTVVMTVQSVGYINFLIGDWIEVFGRQYTLNTLGEPQRIGENTFEYNLVFEGVNYELTKVVYRSADYSGFNPTSDFPLTGTAESFLTVLQYNLDRAFGQGVWAIGSFPATEAKTLSFVSENCLLALNRVCSEFGLEYEIKIIGGVKTINLGAVGDTLPLNLEYGKGKGLYSLTRTNVDSKNIVTRLYVEGSDRNVKAGYRDNALRLRIAANAESYIDSASAASFGIIEGSKIFEDIFPHREGTVSAINASDILEFTDSGMDFDLAETDSNGTKWLIAGQSAKIHFNTGALAGYEFELTAYNHSTKKFKIKPFKDERGLQFPNPDSAAFQIKTGDKYVILDIIMPEAYIQAAEAELLARGQEYLSQNDQPRVEYSLDLDRFFLKSMFSGPGFEVNFLDAGDYLHIKDSKIGVDKEVRVKTFTRDVIDPWIYQVSLSDVIEPTRIELLLADTLETKKAARQSKLFDPARSRRNWRDVEEVAGMVDTLRAEMALIGTSEGQFQIDSFFEINKGGNPDSFGATAGVLAHDAFEGDSGSVWNIGAFDVALSQNQPYYLYAQCSRLNTGAVFTVSLTKIGVEDVGGYYHFPVGIISSVKDNARTLTTVYGYTLISGNNISTGIIQNQLSGIYINLLTGEIRGNIKFTSGQSVEEAITDQQIYVEYSVNGSTNWHTTFTAGDLYMRQKKGAGAWSAAIRIVGEAGAAGATGPEGRYTDYQFAKNTSATTAPTSGWQDSPPAISAGEYVWMRTGEVVPPATAPSSWSAATRITGDKGAKGDQGVQGIPGTPGADGVTYYTWVKYADSPTSGMSDYPSGKAYMGLAHNKTTATESSNYADYTWSLIKGTDGQPGAQGANGQTLYTWIKYADTPTSGMSDSPTGKTYIGLAVNKTTATESTAYGDYTWSLIKGADGRSVAGTDVEFAQTTSATVAPTSGWQTTAPAWESGKYIWHRTKTTYSTGNPTYSDPVNLTGAPGSTGAAGATGTGVDSITEEYYLSTSKTAQSGGSWSTNPPTWEMGKYMWTRVKIVYKNPASTVYTTPVVSSEWEAVDAVQVGGRNLLKLSDYSKVPDQAIFNNVHIKPNTTYTLSDYNGAFERGQVAILDSGGSNLFIIWDWSSTYKKRTFTTPTSITEGDYVIRFWKAGGGDAFEASGRTIKLETGNRATDWTPAPEDVTAEIASAKQEALTAAGNAQSTANSASTAVGSLSGYVDGAFKDGVIDAAESKAIEKYKNTLNEAMAKAESSYSKVYTNSYLSGTAKTTLQNTKINLWGQRDTLISAINTAIAGGTTTPTQKLAVDNAFGTFNSLMSAFQNALEDANRAIQVELDNISKGYVDAVQVGGRNLLLNSGGAPDFLTTSTRKRYEVNAGELARSAGGEVTITFEAKCDDSTDIEYYIYAHQSDTYLSSVFSSAASPAWASYSVKLTLPLTIPSGDDISFTLRKVSSTAGFDMRRAKLELGNRATDWTPAPEDVDAGIAAAQSAADTANALISDIASDSKLTAAEKKAVRKEWEIIVAEYGNIMTQLASFGVPSNNYGAAYYQLGTYLNNGTNWTTGVPVWISDANLGITTNIDGALFRDRFKTYYDQRTKALNAIAAKNKESVDALDYLAEAIEGDTTIEGGLVGTNVLQLKDSGGAVRGGLSGLATDNIGFWTGGTYQQAIDGVAKIILRKDGSGQFVGGLIKMLADGDTMIGDVHLDPGGALVVKEGTDNRVLITKDDITTLAAIANSTQNTTVNNSDYNTFPFPPSGSPQQPNAITVNNNGTKLTVTGSFGLSLATNAGQRNSQATLSASVYLRKVGDGRGTGVLLSSGSVTVNKLTGVPMSDYFSNRSFNKVAVVSAGQYRIVADYTYQLSGPGPNEDSYYNATLFINASSMHALYDGAYQRNEIGKNGIGVIIDANNYSFFGKEDGSYRAVEKVSNATMYDKPGVLFAGNIASGGGLTAGYWGAKYRAGSYREGNNIYRIHHNVGHTNYYVHLTPHSDARMWVISKATTYVRVQASLASLSFDFAITGNNQ